MNALQAEEVAKFCSYLARDMAMRIQAFRKLTDLLGSDPTRNLASSEKALSTSTTVHLDLKPWKVLVDWMGRTNKRPVLEHSAEEDHWCLAEGDTEWRSHNFYLLVTHSFS